MNKITKTIASVIATFAFVAVFAASANAAFPRSLTVGMTGTDVTELQTWLNQNGYLAVAPTGYFGNLTKAAVAAFQAANGITPAAGYFGPITNAKVLSMMGGSMTGNFPAGCTSASGFSTTTGAPCNTGTSAGFPAGCTSAVGFSPLTGASCSGGSTSTGPLAGTDGSISDVSELSQYNNEEVGEGEEDVKVAGFEVEASNDGDIALRSIKIELDPAGNSTGDSDHLDDYVSSVKVWMGDKEIGSADAEDFNEEDDDTFTKTITLNSGVVVKADDTEKFYITVDAVNSFDSSDIDSDSWSVDVLNIRYEDGSGVVTTESDITDLDVAIDFVSFSESADTELKFSSDSSSPEEGIVLVEESENTDDVVLTKGKIKLEGTSDVVLDELPVTLTVTGATDVDMVTSSVKLTIDGEEYTETVSTSAASATVIFDNLDITLEAGKTYSFTISADITDTDGDLDEGDTLTASITSTNREYVDAEDEEGDQLVSADKTGTVTGEAQEFRVDGIMVSLVSTDTSATTGTSSNDDLGTFKIKFKVKAEGETIYVSSLVADALTYTVDKSGTATTGNTISATITNITDNDKTSVGNYEIEDGEEETFELIVTAQLGAGGTAGQYRSTLTGVKWDTSDDTSPANTYTSNLDSFRTSYIGLN